MQQIGLMICMHPVWVWFLASQMISKPCQDLSLKTKSEVSTEHCCMWLQKQVNYRHTKIFQPPFFREAVQCWLWDNKIGWHCWLTKITKMKMMSLRPRSRKSIASSCRSIECVRWVLQCCSCNLNPDISGPQLKKCVWVYYIRTFLFSKIPNIFGIIYTYKLG